MKSTSKKLVLFASAAGLAALAAYGYQIQRAPKGPQVVAGKGDAAPPMPPPAAARPISVEVAEVVRVAMPEELSAVGTLASSQSVIMRPEIAGRIAEIGFRDGAPVERGSIVFRLDDATQRAELAQAKAALELARSNAVRTEDLFARKFVSGSARDQASANLRVAEAAVELAAARLQRTVVRAPFRGVVGIRKVSVGDYVKEGADVVNLEDLSSLKVDFRVPEGNLSLVRVGQSLSVVTDAYLDRGFSAVVEAIDPQVDPQGRSVMMRARIDNREGLLRPGMFARVRLLLAERPPVVAVPEEALVPTGEGQFAFVLEGERARRVSVETGLRRNAMVEVTRGLEPGMKVITAGQLKLRENSTVKVAGAAAVTAEAAAR